MLMNDDEKETRNKHAKSPLKNDECGRFSRKGKGVNKLLPYYPYFDDAFVALFVLFSLGHYFLVNFFASIKFFALCETLLVALMAIFFTIFMIISFDFLNKKHIKLKNS